MKRSVLFLILSMALLGAGCRKPADSATGDLTIAYEKFELDNGLDVVFHIDRSDPVVAVALTAHVGSAREKQGRTGFAHLFEHLFFLESENLGKGGLDAMSARIGGSGANGSTSRDLTNYFQTVPNDALEKMIWAEADKLGWFINTVTEPVLAKEKQVVKNEKRQGVDNQPYGHTSYVIDKHLYPEDHPYNWQVIGSLDDLQNATLEDVKEFYRQWYVPNNTTLVVSGDFDPVQAKEWVKKYFDEIPMGAEVPTLEKRPGRVEQTVRLMHEDNFARLPELTLTWPGVEQFHPDSYALDVLTTYLSQSKNSPFYKILVEEKELAPRVRMFNRTSELAGQVQLSVRAHPGKDLDSVYNAIAEAWARFEAEGIPATELERIKAQQEAGFYQGLSTVLGKGFQLANYNILAGDPGFVKEDIRRTLAVTAEDVTRAYQTFIRQRPHVITSFVPKGSAELALEGSLLAEVVEEPIVAGAEETFDASLSAAYERTPSSFDRTQEPPSGPNPQAKVPEVWQSSLSNGLRVYGIENGEVPMVNFNLIIDGGPLLDSMEKVGVANLLADLMTKGTQARTAVELEEAIEQLGASISVNASEEGIVLSGNTLARNYAQTMELVMEILLEPRWDEGEFALAVQRVQSQIESEQANPNSLATRLFNEKVYGPGHIRSRSPLGTLESVSGITLEDLKGYYAKFISPTVARMHLVGSVSQEQAVEAIRALGEQWEAREVQMPEFTLAPRPASPQLFFYDVPGAKQSVLRIGYLALAETEPDFYPATVANYRLGGGGFASQFMQELREARGYTYGIGSGFSGSTRKGPFVISSGVRSNVTRESLQAIKEILDGYAGGFTEADMDVTRSYFLKSGARAFESAGAKIGLLQDMSAYGWEPDFVREREKLVREISPERISALAREYFDANRMIWVVVGDADTQLNGLNDLGLGAPILINTAGDM